MILVKLCVKMNLKSIIYQVFRRAFKLFSDGHILTIFFWLFSLHGFKIIQFQALT